MKVCLIRVETVQEKLAQICATVTHHFHRGERWLLLADHQRSIDYIDELLWRFPADSFLPHVATDQPVHEPIVLTTRQENLNRATVAFSFLTSPPRLINGIHTLFDLDDQTTPEKGRASLKRREEYVRNGFSLLD